MEITKSEEQREQRLKKSEQGAEDVVGHHPLEQHAHHTLYKSRKEKRERNRQREQWMKYQLKPL